MPNYSKTEIITKVENALGAPAELYKKGFVDYRGDSIDTKEPYSEIVSKCLLEKTNIEVFNAIKIITRTSSYKVAGHNGKTENESSNHEEEHIALDMFNEKLEYPFGRIIDYQVPLKNVRSDTAGKVDLLSSDGKNLYILELKRPKSDETLLRCVLEIYTYWRIINIQKLLWDYDKKHDAIVYKAALVFKDSQAHNDYKNPEIRKLMEKLGVGLFVLNKDYSEVVESYPAVSNNTHITEDFSVLTAYISKIMEEKTFGEISSIKGDGTADSPLQVSGLIEYSPIVESFVETFYAFMHAHPEYDLTDYNGLLKKTICLMTHPTNILMKLLTVWTLILSLH